MLPFFYYKHRARTKMAGKFNLTAQLQLQAPTNVRQVANQIQAQLSNVVISPKFNTQSLANYQKQLTNVANSAANVGKNLNTASRSANSLGAALGAAARRFASITLATGFFLGLVRGISDAVGRAVEFERELLKISQVTGKTSGELRGLTKEVTRLATGLGVSSSELLNTARTLNQAGFSATKTKAALEILARTDLAATFENLKATTEGAIALLRQFRTEAKAAGGDIKFLEQSLDAINAVSKNFAVEAGDLIAVIRRTGGVFEAAGGKLNELIALFTSVRGTTRETAETIATGFRTIFTRIQRTETVDQLRELGIELRNAKGEFVGPLEAIKRLQIGLAGLSATDFRFQEIIEQLGGFRQVGKVIPLLKQYETTAEALAIANGAMGSTAADAATAQQGLGNAFQKLKEKFDATVRNIADSDTFQTLARGAIQLAEAILNVVEALGPLMPLLASLAAFKLGQIAIPALGKFAGIGGKNQGGRIYGFNKGGFVPGQGNRDTVPAMLTPGEFVIKKSSVKSIGAGRLAAANGYNNGTVGRGAPAGGRPVNPTMMSALTAQDRALMGASAQPATFTPRRGVGAAIGLVAQQGGDGPIASKGGAPFQITNPSLRGMIHKKRGGKGPAPATMLGQIGPGQYDVFSPSMPDVRGGMQSLVDSGVRDGLGLALQSAVSKIEASGALDIPPAMQTNEKTINRFAQPLRNDKQIVSTMSGYMFEGVLGALLGATHTGGSGFFDLPAGIFGTVLPKAKAIFGQNVMGSKAELKRSRKQLYGVDGIANKVGNELNTMGYTSQSGVKLTGFNKGGSVDTVPAMLTPGEFVINKSSAQAIGYSNLNSMNKTGVAHFNKGGSVGGVQFLAGGGMAGVGNAAMMMAFMAPMMLEFTNMEEATKKAASQALTLSAVLGMLIIPAAANIDAKFAEATSSTVVTKSNLKQAAASGGLPGPFTILAVAITVLIGIIQYFKASLEEAAKAALESQDEMLSRAREGKGNVDQASLDDEGSKAIRATAANEAMSWTNMFIASIPVVGMIYAGKVIDDMNKQIEVGTQAMGLLNKARATEANATGARINAMKEIEKLDLEGAEKRKAEIKANADYTASMKQLAAENNAYQAFIDSDPVAQGIMSQEQLNEAVEDHTSKVKDAAKQQQEIVREQRAALDDMISEMRDGGKSFAEIFGSDEYRKQLNEIGNAAAEAARLESQASGDSRKQALADMGIDEETLKNMTGAERELMAQRVNSRTAAYESKAAEEARQEAMKGTDERHRKAAEAEEKRQAELDALRRAEVEVMEAEIRRREVLNRLTAAQLSYMNTVDGMIGSIKGLSGAIQDTANNSMKLAETLKDGFTPEAFAAASNISPAIANNIKEGLEKNKKIREGLIGITREKGGQKLSVEQRKESLSDIGLDLGSLSQDMQKKVLAMLEDGIQPDEIEELTGIFGAEVGQQIDILKKLNDAQQKHIQFIREAGKLELEARKKIRAAVMFEVDVRQKGADRLRQATGKEITIAEARADMNEKVNAATMGQGGLGVQQLGGRAAGLLDQRNNIQVKRDARGKKDAIDQQMANDQKFLNQQINNTKEALKELADQSKLASAVMSEIEKEQGKRAAVQESIKSFTFATNEQRAGMTQEFAALTRVLQTGNLNSIPDQMRGAVGKLLDQFKDIEFMPGMTGGDISKRLQVQQMDQQFRRMSGGRQGVPPQLVKAIFESTTKEEQLIEDLKAINAEEQAAAAQLRKLEQHEAEVMIQAAQAQIIATTKLLEWLQANMEGASDEIAAGNANGGLIYRAGGGSIFQARGTDTVPAMLTPGEFVVRKSAVDKIGIGALTALNNGNANTVYKAGGGLVADGSSAAMYNARGVGARGIRMAVEKASGDKARGLSAFTAYRDNDLAKLIGATGGQASPFAMIKNYVNALKQYEFLFKNLTPTGLKLKDDPASVEGAARALQNLRQIYGRWDGVGLYPQFIGKEFHHNRMFLENALANPQIAAAGIKQDAAAPQNAGAMRPSALTPEQRAKNKKKSQANAAEARKNKGMVPYPEFYEGKLVGYDENRKIPYAEFVKLKREHEAEYAADVEQEQAIRSVEIKEFRDRMFNVSLLNLRGHSASPPRMYMKATYGTGPLADRKLFSNTPPSAYLRPQQERDWAQYGAYDDERLRTATPISLSPANVGPDGVAFPMSSMYKGWLERSAASAKKRRADYEKIVMNASTIKTPTLGGDPLDDLFASSFARGGSVDSVPAMLTPGEFVMNPSAVKKHGTGFMNAVNRGKVPGFARGGSVGGVQYRQNGGILSSMGSGLMEGISSALSSFEGIANILSSVASVFSDMSISHTVQVDGTLNIPGFSQEAINQIIGVIGNQVVDSVSGKIDIALEQFKNEQNQRSD